MPITVEELTQALADMPSEDLGNFLVRAMQEVDPVVLAGITRPGVAMVEESEDLGRAVMDDCQRVLRRAKDFLKIREGANTIAGKKVFDKFARELAIEANANQLIKVSPEEKQVMVPFFMAMGFAADDFATG